MQTDLQKEYYKAQAALDKEMFSSVIDYGKHAMNTALLVNAGAAVALLSYIGTVTTKTPGVAIPQHLTYALLMLAVGVGMATLGSGGSYCTQYFYTAEKERAGIGFHIATVTFVVLSYVLFFSGGITAFFGLRAILGQ